MKVWGLVFASMSGSLLLIYDQLSSKLFSNNIKTIKCNQSLAVTGAVKSITHDKMYHKLELEYLKVKRWMRRLWLV